MTEVASTCNTGSATVRARYQAVEAQVRFMLAAARVSDWALFWQLEMECARLVQVLKACQAPDENPSENQPPEDTGWAAERHNLMLRMLHADARIRELLQLQGQAEVSPGSLWLH